MKYCILIFLLVSLLWACSTDELDTYNSGRYVYFSEGIAGDSIRESFFFYPGETTHEVKFELSFSGIPTQEDMVYQIGIDERYTTAVKGTDFDFDENQTWKAGARKDTMVLTLKKSNNLDDKMLRVVLKVVANDNFGVGYVANSRSQRVSFTSMAISPAWWTTRIVEYYLGEYTDTKYAKFIEVTGISDMTDMTATELRYYSLKLKYHLIAMKDAGTPVMDDDGEMRVPVEG